MRRITQFFRARLSRVIFAWFAVAIVITTIVIGVATFTYFAASGESSWHARGERFVAGQLAAEWDDAERRQAVLDALGTDLGLQVALYNPDGVLIGRSGPKHCHAHEFSFDVIRQETTLGSAVLCDPSAKGKRGVIFTLLIFGVVLWGASGLVASRIARPLRKLSQTARNFGHGDLSARAPELDEESELAELSAAFNDMAVRISAQIAEHHTLLAEVSHELRTPLGHLRILIELIRQEKGESAHLEGLESEVENLDYLVDQLLAKSRLDFEMERTEQLDPIDLAVSACESVGVDVMRLEAHDGLSPVLGDAMLLHSALTNVLRNAQTHGGGVVGFQISRNEDAIRFVVEDEGPGRATDFQALIVPFSRGDSDATGLGLGLSLVERIVEAHRGTLFFEQRTGGGLRVGFELPVA